MTTDTQTDAPEGTDEGSQMSQTTAEAAQAQAEANDAQAAELAAGAALMAAQRNAARQAMFVQMRIQMQATIMNGILASMAPEDDAVSVARAGRIADAILADNGITRA